MINDRPAAATTSSDPPRSRGWQIMKITLSVMMACLLIGGGALAWQVYAVPLELATDTKEAKPAVIVEASDGTLIGLRGELRGTPALREDLPDHLVNAVIAIEDRRFFDHRGIDIRGVGRAAWRNFRANGVVEGGSSITQQLAKIEFLSSERTMKRKVDEALVALRLEARLSKDDILTRYLNNVYFGGGAVGIGAAALAYFDKPVSELTLAESAMLAGIIRAPSRANALHNLEEAQARANVVLGAMVDTGLLTQQEALAAQNAPATPNTNAPSRAGGSWFADWILSDASTLGGPGLGSVRAKTTLRPEWQALAERIIAEKFAETPGGAAMEVALVAMTHDGAVVAMVGGRDYATSQYNRAVQARRQPGSTFKLFVYLAALRQGWQLGDVLNDTPIEIGDWRPENYDGAYSGDVRLDDAFARSLNAATVRLAQDVGIEAVIKAAKDLGIDADLDPNISLSLGTSGVGLLDLTGAFASVAAGRTPIQPWAISSLAPTTGSGGLLAALPQQASQPLDHQADLIALLEGVVRNGTGRHAALDGFAAGKTGTSQENRDALFVGFTEQLVVGVWVGNDDDTPMPGVTGGDLPARIWQAFMAEATGLAPMNLGALRPMEAVDAPSVVSPTPVVRAAPSRRVNDAVGKGRAKKAKGRGKAKGKKR
ncbi:PBP1A family penicillin-binding protein [Pseudotabrizicola sediminis]|uniref:peptidoglycan glycosyltransferase n=2 Tax=Pseudotabrizicola sediminis TaxID=2486418 RepID=A0ABY2KH59_9RHOB|nr:PBP1A family penicillin-binding protein [Pseudotabrizicola sediminis]